MRLPIKLFDVARSPLWVILPVFILMGCLYSVSTPLFESSDELRHVAVVDYLLQGRGLPVQNPQHHEFFEQEGSQPPLYYLLVGLLARPIGLTDFRALAVENPHTQNIGRADATNNRNMLLHSSAENLPWHDTTLFVHMARLIGVLMGAVTVGCSWFIACELSGPSDQIARPLLAASLTAFNPMFVFISASVNNDNLVIVLSSISILLALRALRLGLTSKRALILGCVLGCAALSKTSGLVPAVVIPVFLALHKRHKNSPISSPRFQRARLNSTIFTRLDLLNIFLILGPIILIAGWFYLRNWLLYGEPTGTQMMVLIAGAREHTATAIELIGEWDGFFKAYWGLFGAVNIPMNDRIYVALEIFVALGIVGLAAQLYLFIQQRNRSLSFGEVPVSLAISMCATLFALSFIAFLRWTSQTFASQGRLLFPVITIVSVFLASGHTTLTSLLTRRLLARGAIPSGIFLTLATYAIPICLAMLTALAPILNIVPAYALPNRGAVAGEGCPMEQGGGAACFAPATRTEIRFGDSIRWIGFSTQPRYPRLSQPDVLDITLYWQALKPIRQNLSLFIKLYDSANNEVFAMDGTPGGGMLQTTEWQPGWVIADHYQLRVQQPIQTPTALRMDAGFYEFSTRQNLATFDSRGNPTGRQRFEVAGVGDPANPGITSLARTSGIFTANANHPRAISVALESPTRHGNNLTVPLTWLTVAPIDGDFTVFAQLFDDQNLKIGQADGRPVDNTFGTQWWPPGLPVSEVREFSIGSPPPGHYTLHYGLYDAAQPSLPRLAAFTPTGTPAPDNILVYEFDLR